VFTEYSVTQRQPIRDGSPAWRLAGALTILRNVTLGFGQILYIDPSTRKWSLHFKQAECVEWIHMAQGRD